MCGQLELFGARATCLPISRCGLPRLNPQQTSRNSPQPPSTNFRSGGRRRSGDQDAAQAGGSPDGICSDCPTAIILCGLGLGLIRRTAGIGRCLQGLPCPSTASYSTRGAARRAICHRLHQCGPCGEEPPSVAVYHGHWALAR